MDQVTYGYDQCYLLALPTRRLSSSPEPVTRTAEGDPYYYSYVLQTTFPQVFLFGNLAQAGFCKHRMDITFQATFIALAKFDKPTEHMLPGAAFTLLRPTAQVEPLALGDEAALRRELRALTLL